MKVGVEASYCVAAKAGIARYLDCMITEMMLLAPDIEFFFYAPRPVEITLAPVRWRLRAASGLAGRFVNAWIQTQVPRWVQQDRLDVFWGQNSLLPLHLPRRCFRVLTVHDLAPLVCPQTIRLTSVLTRRYYLPKACRAADVVVVDSDSTARDVVRLLGISREKVRRVYFGINDRFRPLPIAAAKGLVAQKYGLPDEYLLTVGTIEPRKDHTTLLRALRRLPQAPLLAIAGGIGWKAGNIVREISAMEKAGRVRYLGRIDDGDLPALYSAARLFVFPSIYEGFGLPVLEAMACGCPVLCSWSSSLPEVGGAAVRYFRTGDSQDLARQIEALLHDERQRARMVANGILQAGRFSFRQAARDILDIMRAGIRPATPTCRTQC